MSNYKELDEDSEVSLVSINLCFDIPCDEPEGTEPNTFEPNTDKSDPEDADPEDAYKEFADFDRKTAIRKSVFCTQHFEISLSKPQLIVKKSFDRRIIFRFVSFKRIEKFLKFITKPCIRTSTYCEDNCIIMVRKINSNDYVFRHSRLGKEILINDASYELRQIYQKISNWNRKNT